MSGDPTQDMEAVDRHWTAYLHTAFILYKAATTIFGTLTAAKAWNTQKLKMSGPAQMLLIFNAILVALATLYKFTSKHIGPLFVLQCLSHYGFLLAFTVLVEYNENSQVRNKGRKILGKLMPLHAVFVLVLLYGYFKQSRCRDEHPYPNAFVMGDVLFYVVFAACIRFNKLDLESCWSVNPSEDEAKLKSLNDAQFGAFYSSLKMMAVWHGVELLIGRFLFQTVLEGGLTCGNNGKDWVYRSGPGHLFLTLHILGSMQSLGMHRKVFIGPAKAAGLVPLSKRE